MVCTFVRGPATLIGGGIMIQTLQRGALAFCKLRLSAEIGRTCRGFVSSESGAPATEFVLVMPVFLLFLFGIMAFGSVLYIQNAMENGAREAARLIAVSEVPHSATPITCATAAAGSAEDYACGPYR